MPKASASNTFVTLNRELRALREEQRKIREDKEYLERQVRLRTAQLTEANEELASFSYSVSHDPRAPLRHISGFGKLLEERLIPTSDETSVRYLRLILQARQRAGALIDDLLSFSRMGRTEMRHTLVDMKWLVGEVVEELALETEDRSVDCRIGELPEVRGDPAMLRLVMLNLLSNAVKYTRPRARAEIEVGSVLRAAETVFFVRDNGVGFSEANSDRLFGVFQRLHTEEEFEGTSIGLASVKRIVRRRGGRAWAEAHPEGGATFYFPLPQSLEIDTTEPE